MFLKISFVLYNNMESIGKNKLSPKPETLYDIGKAYLTASQQLKTLI
jgi:hypothetical protein